MNSIYVNHGKKWTAKEIWKLIDLVDSGLTYAEIAMLLGRTYEAVRNKLRAEFKFG